MMHSKFHFPDCVKYLKIEEYCLNIGLITIHGKIKTSYFKIVVYLFSSQF